MVITFTKWGCVVFIRSESAIIYFPVDVHDLVCSVNCLLSHWLLNFQKTKKHEKTRGRNLDHVLQYSVVLQMIHQRKISGTLGMVPLLFNPPRSHRKGDIPIKYPLHKVYMGLIIKGAIPRVPPFSL